MKHLTALFSLVMLVAISMHAQATKPADTSSYTMPVGGDVKTPVTITPETLRTLPRHSVTAKGHDPEAHTYSGVFLADVLRQAGVPFGKDLRGPAMKTAILVEASDGYGVVFALPELDSDFTDKVVLLADQVDGHAFTAEQGPLRVIVPDEKRPARWIRQVSKITVQMLGQKPAPKAN